MFSENSVKEQNKLLSGISLFMCAMLIIGMLFSSFYIASEYNHHCQGDGCPVCQIVAICESFLNNATTGLSICAVAVFAVLFAASLYLLTSNHLVIPTLVSQKVRLNN